MKRTPIQRRKEASIRIRMNCGCMSCGYRVRERRYVKTLQFHHVDASTKVGNPSDLVQRRDDIFYPELRKCVILCANCHIKEHVDQDDLGKRRQTNE